MVTAAGKTMAGKTLGGGADRPEFRNIHISQIVGYRLPLAGLVSILHRISGAAMFLIGLPLILWLFQQSVLSELSFERYRVFVSHPLARLVLIGLMWAFLHHLFAGIRHLLMDLDIGVAKEPGRTSAATVLVLSLATTLVFVLKITGIF
jgi:succinate dehydrogenase / fumarate reductase cytochrome b subunit